MKRYLTSFVVLALVGVALAVWQPWADDTVVIDLETDRAIAEVVSVRTLTDEITVRGELRRDELQVINSAVDGKISDVLVEDGDTVQPGDVLFALDGRRAVAVNGDFAFYRRLDVGSEGPDVLQLETILSDSGYDVGKVDEFYTEETRLGLSAWQVDHDYGGATMEVDRGRHRVARRQRSGLFGGRTEYGDSRDPSGRTRRGGVIGGAWSEHDDDRPGDAFDDTRPTGRGGGSARRLHLERTG